MLDDTGYIPAGYQTLGIVIDQLGRPPTINNLYARHWRFRACAVRDWRTTAAVLWRAEMTKWRKHQIRSGKLDPPNRLTAATVAATPLYQTAKSLPDVGACVPAVKAVIDAAADVGLIIDDTPDHIRQITYHAPDVGRPIDGLFVAIAGEPI